MLYSLPFFSKYTLPFPFLKVNYLNDLFLPNLIVTLTSLHTPHTRIHSSHGYKTPSSLSLNFFPLFTPFVTFDSISCCGLPFIFACMIFCSNIRVFFILWALQHDENNLEKDRNSCNHSWLWLLKERLNVTFDPLCFSVLFSLVYYVLKVLF